MLGATLAQQKTTPSLPLSRALRFIMTKLRDLYKQDVDEGREALNGLRQFRSRVLYPLFAIGGAFYCSQGLYHSVMIEFKGHEANAKIIASSPTGDKFMGMTPHTYSVAVGDETIKINVDDKLESSSAVRIRYVPNSGIYKVYGQKLQGNPFGQTIAGFIMALAFLSISKFRGKQS